MPPILSIATAATVATGLLCAAPAAAQTVSAQGLVTGLAFELIDLDPDDGLAPGATWLDGSTLVSGDVGAGPLTFADFAPGALVPLAAGRSAAGTDAAAAVTAAGLQAGGSTGGGSFYASALTGYGLESGGIVLGAMTGLRLGLGWQLDATVGATDPACLQCASAQVNLSVILGTTTEAPAFQTAFAAAYADLGPASDSQTGSVVLQFDNFSAGAVVVDAGVSLIASGQSFAAPVPEATTATLLLAGLALGGAAALRSVTRRRE